MPASDMSKESSPFNKHLGEHKYNGLNVTIQQERQALLEGGMDGISDTLKSTVQPVQMIVSPNGKERSLSMENGVNRIINYDHDGE